MRPLSLREKSLIAIAASALIVVVYLFALLLPAREQGRQLARQESMLQEQIAAADKMYREAEVANGEIIALRAELDNLLFSKPDVKIGMVREVEQLASETKVTLTSVRPGEVESVAGAVRYPLILKFEADFGTIARFLYELEQPSRQLWVEGVEITSARQSNDKLQVTVYIEAYEWTKEEVAHVEA